MRIIGLVITLALILLAMGDVTTFIDIPSALFVIGLTVGGLIFSGAGIPNMFSASFSVDATNEELLAPPAPGPRPGRTYWRPAFSAR